MNLSQELTKECQRDACQLTGLDSGTSTCIGWMPTYDKHGNRTDRGDPNIFTQSIKCLTCGASWSVQTRRDERTITRRDGPSPA